MPERSCFHFFRKAVTWKIKTRKDLPPSLEHQLQREVQVPFAQPPAQPTVTGTGSPGIIILIPFLKAQLRCKQ